LTKEPYISTKESSTSTKEPYIVTKEPCILTFQGKALSEVHAEAEEWFTKALAFAQVHD